MIDWWLPPDRRYGTMEEWLAAEYRDTWGAEQHVSRVASTTIAYAVADGWMLANVSTVFLRLDHNWGGGPPILWETMVFGWPTNASYSMEADGDRYTNPEAATLGHKRMVNEAQLGLDIANFPVLVTVTAQCEWWRE